MAHKNKLNSWKLAIDICIYIMTKFLTLFPYLLSCHSVVSQVFQNYEWNRAEEIIRTGYFIIYSGTSKGILFSLLVSVHLLLDNDSVIVYTSHMSRTIPIYLNLDANHAIIPDDFLFLKYVIISSCLKYSAQASHWEMFPTFSSVFCEMQCSYNSKTDPRYSKIFVLALSCIAWSMIKIW